MTAIHTIFLAWLDAADWAEWRRLDAAGLQQHHAEWLQRFEELEQQYRVQGIQVVRQPIRPAAFAEWCLAMNIAPDNKARSRYVGIVAERRHRH